MTYWTIIEEIVYFSLIRILFLPMTYWAFNYDTHEHPLHPHAGHVPVEHPPVIIITASH